MTSDDRFLKAAHIVPEEIQTENWMDWREEDIRAKDALIIEQGRCIFAQQREIKRWKFIAFTLGAFAAMLFIQPIIQRLWQ